MAPGFGFLPEAWARALVASGSVEILREKVGAADTRLCDPMAAGDDARQLVDVMRGLIKQVIDFPAPRCMVAGP